ncbi:hypothetical protein [Sinomicrobium soli]|uniref:hypothetical protein n=1 Tax=Sinomicrobium sp. N-1-3-6 TaxID=2219864 RepID=UPI000DCD913E|nr:hypothetical protein [Sinomicrobium sp. N-1-3-6]RAV30761.1 hypothetical protein DN748_00435 [Sinomicrobium sp. N-1-3-6]
MNNRMYNKIGLFFLAILVSCMSENMDLSKLKFDEKIENYLEFIEVKETREIDLADDYRFYKMDDEGAIERNESNLIRDYHISPDSKQASYNNIPFDELLIRTVNGIIIGYKFETYDADHTENLRKVLKEQYGEGKLVFGPDNANESQVFLWKKNGIIIQFGTIKYSEKKENGERTYWLGSNLILIKEENLKKGQWPIYKKFLKEFE